MNGDVLAQQQSMLTTWTGKARRSLRHRGVAGTLRHFISLLREQYRRNFTWNPYSPLRQFLDRRYDARFGVDTAGIDPLPEIQSTTANWYSPAPRSTLLRIFHRIRVDYSEFVFVDLGCGKGKALLVAAELPFKRIVGVEIAPRLAGIARDNLNKLQLKKRIPLAEVVAADVREYSFPDQPLIIFLYDPFTAEVMEPVLENIRSSLQSAPRTIYIIYLVPSQRHLFSGCGFLSLVTETAGYCVYASLPLPAPGHVAGVN